MCLQWLGALRGTACSGLAFKAKCSSSVSITDSGEGLWVLSDTQVLAAPGELDVYKYILYAPTLVLHLKLSAWLHKDGETLLNPYPMHRHTLYLFG